MDGTLDLAGVDVLISAEYDSAQGWTLSGGTAAGKTLSFRKIAKDLLESMSLHSKLPDLELTDITFSAAPAMGEYSVGGRTAAKWELIEGIKLTVDEFRAEKTRGASVTGRLNVSLTVAEKVMVWLSAEKAAAEAGGWVFEGGSGPDQQLEIGELLEWIAGRFQATPPLPEALKTFKVDMLRLSFQSESQDFFFTCRGEVQLPQFADPIQGIITIDIKHQRDKAYTKVFAGSLTIDGIEFDLVFESSRLETDGDSQRFVASYHDSAGHTIKIDDLVNKCLDVKANTGLEISLKDALFAYQHAES
jgi:hypothetical protein